MITCELSFEQNLQQGEGQQLTILERLFTGKKNVSSV